MIHLPRRDFLAFSAAALVAPDAYAATPWSRAFGDFVADGLATTNTPGMSVAIVRDGRGVFSAGYGYADVEKARRVTADSVFQIASVTKTVTGLAMMMLWEDGRFKLDDPIAPLLDFKMVHPKFSDVPITFRHLLTHTSGISDVLYDTLEYTDATTPPLRDFLSSYLSPDGKLYDADKCYSADKPGTAWSYSNVAVALLGYLAGRVCPDPLDTVTKTRLFAPLGLRNTAWRYAGIGDEQLALPYEFKDARFHRLPRETYPDWPAGLLCTSANDFARILAIYTQGGALGGHRFVKPETLVTMFTPDAVLPAKDHPEIRQGLIWRLRDWRGDRIASHNGGDAGAATVAVIDRDRHTAVLAFANISESQGFAPFQKEVVERLLDKARTA
jgi:CubicO group peptidase (beta-lactamase class C family)